MWPGHKFNAKSTVVDGIKFPSLLEANVYKELVRLVNEGKIKFFLRQTPFHLPGDTKYVCDFTIVTQDKKVVFLDSKGKVTPMFKLKKKLVLDVYGEEIVEVSSNEIYKIEKILASS